MKLIKILILICGVLVSAQNDPSTTQSQLIKFTNKFMKDVYTRNYENILEALYPRVFYLSDSAKIRRKMINFYEGNEAYNVNIGPELPPYNLSKIYQKDSTRYAFVTFDLHKTITYHIDLDENSQQAVLDNAKRLGDEGYFINDSRVNLKRRNYMLILLNDPISDYQWKVLNFDENDPLNYRIMPKYMIKDMRKFALSMLKTDN